MFQQPPKKFIIVSILGVCFVYMYFSDTSNNVILPKITYPNQIFDQNLIEPNISDEKIEQNDNDNFLEINKDNNNDFQELSKKQNNIDQPELDFFIKNNEIFYKKDYTPQEIENIMSNNKNKNQKENSLAHTCAKILQEIDYSKYSKQDKKFLKSRMEVYIDRATRVKEVCSKNPDLSGHFHMKFVWDVDHQPPLLWCPQYKVASTSWMVNFLRLKHFNENNPKLSSLSDSKKEQARFKKKNGAGHKQVFTLYPPPNDSEKRQQTYEQAVRVVIVRHPFSRLLSAYRDKMSKLKPRPLQFKFRELQLKIIKKYRDRQGDISSEFPTFSEFVDYVIDSTAKLRTPDEWTKKVNCWVPYWVQCGICSADFTVIMKLETMTEDEKYIITLERLDELKQIKEQEWRHLHNVSSTDAAEDYFNQLSKHQIRLLYKRYKPDFELFAYDIQQYLKYATN